MAAAAGTAAAAPAPDPQDARSLAASGRYAEAEDLARRLIEQTEAANGATSVEVADAIDVLVGILIRARKASVPDALPLARRAVAIRESLFGPDALEVAPSLGNLGTVLGSQGQGAAAEEAAGRAVAIRETALGPGHPEVARALANLARIRINRGDLASAETDLERARSILEQAHAPEYPDLDGVLHNTGVLHAMRGDQAGAIDLFTRVLAIREQALPPDHPEVAAIRRNIGVMMMTAGRTAEARPYLERALALDEARLGPDHPEVASDLFSLGQLDMNTGDLAAALSLLDRSLVIRTRAFGDENQAVAASLTYIARVDQRLGDDGQARAIAERALAIWEKTVGPDHFRVAEQLEDLAALDVRQGDFDQARRRYERALAIIESTVGADSPAAGAVLDGLAEAFRRGGHPDEALPLQERALQILEKRLGPEHPDTGRAVGNLARLLSGMSRDEEARALHQRAVSIFEATLVPPDPTLPWGLRGLALALARDGERGPALEAALRAESIGRDYQNLVTQALPERQALLLAAERPAGLDVALGLAVAAAGDDAIAGRVWDALIRSRALVLDEMAARRRAITAAHDPEVQELAGNLLASSTRLANLLVKGAGAPSTAGDRHAIEEAVAAHDAAERALAERSAEFRTEQATGKAGLREVAAARPAGSALVAYARYDRQDAGPAEASYVAFVLPADVGTPTVVPLGPAETIDRAVSRWRAEVTRAVESSGAEPGDNGLEASYRSAGAELRRAIWDPLADHLGPAHLVFVVPAGALNVVSILALPAGKTEYLVERLPPLQYLSAERDLVTLSGAGRREGGLLVMGGPAYDAMPFVASRERGGGTARKPRAAPANVALAFRGALSTCDAFRTLEFEPLPGTATEAREVGHLWKTDDVVRAMDAQATEATFKSMAPGRRVVHLATHGFFLGPECAPAQAPAGGSADNPLRLSGLALAGANHRLEAGPDQDDGILTAEEIAALDLSGVEWAVLSACDTGGGTVQAGEGVLGLRRAFQIAGARTVLLSLWPVEDRAARSWMRRLYQGRLEGGMGTAAAVHEATLGLLQESRKRGRTTHPIDWGGFVAAGDWR